MCVCVWYASTHKSGKNHDFDGQVGTDVHTVVDKWIVEHKTSCHLWILRSCVVSGQLFYLFYSSSSRALFDS